MSGSRYKKNGFQGKPWTVNQKFSYFLLYPPPGPPIVRGSLFAGHGYTTTVLQGMQRYFCMRCQHVKPCDMSKNLPCKPVGLLLGCCILFCTPGCFKDRITKTYTVISPVYTPIATILAGINGNPAQTFNSVGKVYIKDQYIYVNDPAKGIHIIDNSDPTHPVQTAFLNIPGNWDMAIKGNMLYADLSSELLAIDISNPRQVQVTGRVHNLFSNMVSIGNGQVESFSSYMGDSNLVLTGWTQKDTTVTTSAPGSGNQISMLIFDLPAAVNASASTSSTGVAGSTARIVLVNDYLYAITQDHDLGIVNVTNSAVPALVNGTAAFGYDLETIYPFQNKLFLGSQEGVFIYDISNPVSPVKQGQFTHGNACDPVITDGSYAYVTLHAGTYCGGASNELDVVSVTNLMQPILVGAYPMTKPEGLCKDGNLLFVCDSTQGVKLFDATNPANLQLLTHLGNTSPNDVIAANGRLVVVASQGLYQYDYSDLNNISLLSLLPANNGNQ